MGTLSINKDFRFGPINFLALVLMTCLGGALQTSLPHSPDLPLALSTFEFPAKDGAAGQKYAAGGAVVNGALCLLASGE